MLKYRGLLVAIAGALLILGVLQLRSMPVDVLPEFQAPTVEVQAEALGLSAAEVEQLITVPLEQDLLNGVAWLDVIRSESVPGLSSIELIFEPGTDLYRARQLVQERLSQTAGLPNVSKPPQMLQPMSSTGRVMMIGLSSEKLSLIELSVLARWSIKPRLMGVPGVANVSVWGQRERELQVQVDPARLRERGASLLQVVKTTGNALWVSPLTFLEASTPGTGGFIDTPNQRLTIQHLLPINTPEELAQVTLEGPEGGAPQSKPLRLGDVATVVEDHQPLIGDAVLANGTGLLLVIEKLPGANVPQVTRAVQAALDGLRPGLSDTRIDYSVFRPATYISRGMSNLSLALIIGAVLVLLVLALFLFDWRSLLIGAAAIPLSAGVAVLVMRLLGQTLNWLSLAGLVVGLVAVIDCAVLGVDGIASQLRRRRDEGSDNSSATIILEAAHELRGALIYATIIVLLGLVPLFFIQGVNGALLRPLAISYAAAVLGASAVAMIITPALALLLWPRLPHDRRESPLVRRLGHGYGRALSWSLRSPRPAYVAVIVLAVAGIALVPFYRHTMLPVLHDSDLQVHLEAAPGTSLPEMNRITALVGRELRTVPGVREVGGHVGRAVLSDQVVGANSGELWVRLDPSADYERTLAAISAVAEGYQGLDGQVLTYPTESVHQALAGNDAAFTVRVYGQDVDVLRGKAEEVRQLLSKVGGVNDVNVEAQPEEPTVEIEVDLAKAQSYGIKPGDVRRAAATLLSGLLVGNLFEERKVFDVVVWGTPNTRSNLTTIQNLMIDTPSRGQVRLADVANVQLRPNPTVIRHEAVSRKIDVTAEVQGRSLNAAADEVQHRLKEVSFPLEYHAELLGDYGDPLAARTRLFGLVAVAAIGIFLLLQAALASWRLASLSFVTILASLTGGAVAAFADGRTLTAGSLLGFLAVFGLAARAVIILIRRYQRLEDDGHEEFSPELVRQGSGAQLAPVVITALAAGLAFVPVAVLGDVPGLEIVHAAAPVVLGGLVTWAAVTLFVVPALYLRFGHSWRRRDATP